MDEEKRQNSILILRRKRERLESRLRHVSTEDPERKARFAAEWKRLDTAIKAAEQGE